ncbi:MAG TPA: efflux RND transporter periplasmic adaptor subunit [Myxococcaceae bacterium]|nr:efflux RND transporter periplasmic adaptor subunit [Myxococcaceae bacterium]
MSDAPDYGASSSKVSVAQRGSAPPAEAERARNRIRIVLSAGVVLLLVVGGLLLWRAQSRVNQVALAGSAKPVSVVAAQAAEYRPFRSYIGTLEPWQAARVGPQLISAYVSSVLVRPGAAVQKGEVLATLDCRHATASTRAVAMQAEAIDARQKALADEAARTAGLLDGGFVSPNEAEQKLAQSASEAAQLQAGKAQLARSSLEVNDCVLRSPFDGEVASRDIDPGAYVRPGAALVSVVDRSTVRVTAEAPEVDFAVVEPGTQVKMRFLATKQESVGVISRRAPAADPGTRTVHFEIDVPDPKRTLPVGTTAELVIDVGQPQPASAIPLAAAAVRTGKVTLFTVEGEVAHARVVPLLGERQGMLYLDPSLKPGTQVVLEGRALLQDGDRVSVGAVEGKP